MGNYSRGSVASLPADTTDLDIVYSAQEVIDVATEDGVYVGVTESNDITLHQYKNSVSATTVNLRWHGKSGLAPTTQAVQLQVYKVAAPAGWEDVSGAGATNNTAGALEDFDLTGTIVDTTNYLAAGELTCRVYQGVAAPSGIEVQWADGYLVELYADIQWSNGGIYPYIG